MIPVLLALLALEWPQFGGPGRNFHSGQKVAASWPASGPRRLWARDLGDGYSGISVDGGVLYTMYRRMNQEAVLAADAATGKTLWEHRYDAAFLPSMKMENGPGPHSTPLVTATTVYTTGVLGRFLALDKKTGRVLWQHDLFQEYGGRVPDRGYACSPLAYKDTIVLQAGGPGAALMAFRQKDGGVVWKQHNFAPSPSSPLLIQVAGQDQLVAFMGDQVVGLDPNNGAWLWSQGHRTDWGLNISTPVWGPDNVLFISSAYGGGSRALQLSRSGGKTAVKELWFTSRMRVHHGNAVRIGDFLYGSSGDFGPAPLTAIDVRTGKIAWQDRSFSKANLLLLGDGKLIVLDEDGNLALAEPSPPGLKTLVKAPVLRSNAWTAPALAGSRLFLRDRRSMLALDLR